MPDSDSPVKKAQKSTDQPSSRQKESSESKEDIFEKVGFGIMIFLMLLWLVISGCWIVNSISTYFQFDDKIVAVRKWDGAIQRVTTEAGKHDLSFLSEIPYSFPKVFTIRLESNDPNMEVGWYYPDQYSSQTTNSGTENETQKTVIQSHPESPDQFLGAPAIDICDADGNTATVKLQLNCSLDYHNAESMQSFFTRYLDARGFKYSFPRDLADDIHNAVKEQAELFSSSDIVNHLSEYARTVKQALINKWESIGIVVDRCSMDVQYDNNVAMEYSQESQTDSTPISVTE